jgi:topoisomerase-4 subunit A
VLQRRTGHRLEKIAARLDVLKGLLIVYLNLDEVIRIIRNEDDPKAKLIQRFKLNDVQADAILNTRLRQLRKLEEMEIRREDAALREEQKDLQGLLEDTRKQWRKVAGELKETRKLFGPGTTFGKRRTELGEAAAVVAEVDIEAFVAREPVTVILSEKGWIRALKGHGDLGSLQFKEGDHAQHIVRCETTDKLLAFASDGRAFTLDAHKLPGGRGHGEPIRLSLELGDIDEVVALFVYEEGAKRLVAGHEGYGFVVPESEMLATKRSGKQVLNGRAMQAAKVGEGDQVAVIGERKKLLVFPLSDLPEMNRGKGVKLQSYHDRGLADVKVFGKDEGLSWEDSAGRIRAVAEWKDFRGKRGGAGKIAPKGFSRSGRFSDVIG